MPIKDYPFTQVTPTHSRPMLWIRAVNPDTKLEVVIQAIVDTGADSCAFPADVATELGHELESVPPKTIFTANGPTEAFPHTSRVDILNIQPNGLPGDKVLHTIKETPINFIRGCGDFLLGVENFLSEFVITIDYPRQVFSICKPKK